jgi:hypothetical protein
MPDRLLIYIAIAMSVLTGCISGSTEIKGYDCKMNGGFETIKNGLPVNWYYYSMEKESKGEFDLISDSILFKEGKRSLKFQVKTCESIGGWRSPGFFEEFKVQPGETYKISFSVINEGCDFKVIVGTGMKGNPGPIKTLLRTRETFAEWKYFEYNFDIPQVNDNIRFEANIMSAGTIWFDEIRIEGVNDKRELNLYPYRGHEECK